MSKEDGRFPNGIPEALMPIYDRMVNERNKRLLDKLYETNPFLINLAKLAKPLSSMTGKPSPKPTKGAR